MVPGKRLVDQATKITTYDDVIDAMKCFDRCKDLDDCKAFNFNTGGADCEILDNDNREDLESTNHWSFYDITCGRELATSWNPEHIFYY